MIILNKKAVSLFISLIMIFNFISCSKAEKKEVNVSFIEEQYKFEESIFPWDMVKLDDNSIGIIGESVDGEVVKYVSKDYGESWKKDKINLINTTNKELVVNSMIYLNNGNIMISYSIMKPMIEIEDEIKDKSEKEIEEFFEQCYRNSEKKYVLVNKNNIIEEIDINLEKSNEDLDNLYECKEIRVSSNGDFFILIGDAKKIIQIDQETYKEKNTFEIDNSISEFIVTGDSLIIHSEEEIIEYDISSGEEKNNLEFLKNNFIENNLNFSLIKTNDENKLYYHNVEGLFSYDLNNKNIEKIIDGSYTIFGNEKVIVTSLIVKENGDYLGAFNKWADTGSPLAIINFKYNADMTKINNEKITIYSLVEKDSIRQAVSNYNSNNTETFLKYEVGLDFKNSSTEVDAIKKLNAEISSGNGPDIIILDGLNYEAYVEKGILEDISSITSKNNKLFSNIIEEYTINDKIYTFPVSIKYPILVGPRDKIQKIDNFDSFVEVVKEVSNNTNRPIMEKSYNEKEFICSLYNAYGNDWIVDGNTIDKDNLSNFFKKSKELYIAIEKQNNEYYRKNGEFIQEDTEIGEKDEENYFDIEYYLNSPLFIEAFQMKDPPVFMYGCLNNIWDYSSLITILYQNNEIDYKILNKEAGGVFSSNLLMGINSKSENKEKAKKILEKFISTDINNSNMFSGYNTNKEYISKQLNKYLDYVEPIYDEKISHYAIQDDNKENEYIMVFPNDDDINSLINEIEGIKKTAIVDKRIILEVAKVFENYVKDEYSLNEGIDIIVDNLELYLAE